MARKLDLRVFLILIVIMHACNFGSTMPSLPQKDVLVTADVTASKVKNNTELKMSFLSILMCDVTRISVMYNSNSVALYCTS